MMVILNLLGLHQIQALKSLMDTAKSLTKYFNEKTFRVVVLSYRIL